MERDFLKKWFTPTNPITQSRFSLRVRKNANLWLSFSVIMPVALLSLRSIGTHFSLKQNCKKPICIRCISLLNLMIASKYRHQTSMSFIIFFYFFSKWSAKVGNAANLRVRLNNKKNYLYTSVYGTIGKSIDLKHNLFLEKKKNKTKQNKTL